MGANMYDFAKEESQLVWRRYNNMLVANSILLGFIGQVIFKGDITQKIIPAGACILGLVITLCWLFLTSYGWSLSHRWLLSAEDDCKKIAEVYKDWVRTTWEKLPQDPIWCFAHFVILVFWVAYVFLFYFVVNRMTFIIMVTLSAMVFLIWLRLVWTKLNIRNENGSK